MKRIVCLYAAMTLAACLVGCSGAPDDGAPSDADLLEAQTFWDTFPDAKPITTWEEEAVFDSRYEPPAGSEEKGLLPALLGWSLQGHLQYQDGFRDIRTEPAQDDCSRFGLSCDSQWHIQANDLYYSTQADALDDVRGRCGSSYVEADGLTSEWYPCIMPRLNQTLTVRNIKWRFDGGGCTGSTSVNRRRMHDGIVQAFNYVHNNTTLSFTEVGPTAAANVVFVCEPNLPTNSLLRWTPIGDLTLRWATAGNPTGISGWIDQCETRGLPGYISPGVGLGYRQRPDMMYTYSIGEIAFNYVSLWSFLYGCTVNESELVRGIRNAVLHEFGHHLSFPHQDYDSNDFGIMRPGTQQSCQIMTGYSEGYHTFMLQAINDIDTNPGTNLQVPDYDLSCFVPSQQ